MDREEKIKVAITAGIAGVILLIFILYLALSGNDSSEDEKLLTENISAYSSMTGPNIKTNEENAAASEADSGVDDKADASASASSVMSYNEFLEKKTTVSGNSFYETKTPFLKNVYKSVAYDKEAQLNEMFRYWQEGNQDAVRDLAHLERYEAMSYSLSNTSDFYYYGEYDTSGNPEGTGLAVYADSQYYYGEWHEGKRSGQGTWFAFYPKYNTYVVKEHLYTGEWLNDLPNGHGQEHYDYNSQYMNSEDIYIQNAIGDFYQGKYNGDMYVITIDNNGATTEWRGQCDKGNWKQVPDSVIGKNGLISVLKKIESKDAYIDMSSEAAKNNGITGMISGGNLVK